MISKSIVFMMISCFALYAHSLDLSNSALVSKLQEVGDRLASMVNEIDNEFSARQAIPQLEKLSKEFYLLRAEFSNRQKADPTNVIRFASDVAVTLNKLKSALLKLNAQEDIPLDLRQQITNLLHIKLDRDYF